MVVLSTYETYDIQGSKFLISILGLLYKILLYILPVICGIGIDDAEMLTSEMHDPYTRITVA